MFPEGLPIGPLFSSRPRAGRLVAAGSIDQGRERQLTSTLRGGTRKQRRAQGEGWSGRPVSVDGFVADEERRSPVAALPWLSSGDVPFGRERRGEAVADVLTTTPARPGPNRGDNRPAATSST